MGHRMPERRRRVRILTLKNAGRALLVAIVVLAGVNLLSEIHKTHNGEFGALFDQQVTQTDTVAPRKIEVVTEAPANIEDHDTSDPLLLAPALRQQKFLDTNEIMPRTAQVVSVPQQPLLQTQPQAEHGRLGIVGDENGVSVVGTRRVLRGGFGR